MSLGSTGKGNGPRHSPKSTNSLSVSFRPMLVLPWLEIAEGEAQMNVNGIQGVDEMLRSLRRMALPVMLLAVMSLVGCGDSARDECKDLCDGTQQEIDACRAACDALR